MGKSVQKITENVSLIASAQTWIEGLAIQQLIKTSELVGMQRVVGMPDLHPGRGYPIGAAFFTINKIYPALVGNGSCLVDLSLWAELPESAMLKGLYKSRCRKTR